MRVLVIAAHPDDEVLGCGGTMARHASIDDEVHLLVVTKGIPEIFPQSQVEETRCELRLAQRILGVTDVRFLDFPAPKLDVVPGYKLAESISHEIRRLKPEVVYFPHRGDIHSDHRAVFFATLVATRPVDGCGVHRLLCYETLSETEWAPPSGDDAFIPTLFIDISQFLDRKLEATRQYRSQLKLPPHPRSLQSVEALARLRGSTVGLLAAEAFMLVREVIV